MRNIIFFAAAMALLGAGVCGADIRKALAIRDVYLSIEPKLDEEPTFVCTLAVGDTVVVIEENSDWYKVQSNGKQGWGPKSNFLLIDTRAKQTTQSIEQTVKALEARVNEFRLPPYHVETITEHPWQTPLLLGAMLISVLSLTQDDYQNRIYLNLGGAIVGTIGLLYPKKHTVIVLNKPPKRK